jgi:membrane associated rhomboid family serine protease
MMRITETVKQLIIVNIIFLIGTMIVGQPAYDILALHFPLNPDFKFWQPFTHMFMHSGIRHILFNMLSLFMFGSALEERWGARKFLFFYISCGLGAALLYIGVNYITFYSALDILTENGFAKDQILASLAAGNMNPEWQTYLSDSHFHNFLQAYLVPAVGASGALYGLFVATAFLYPNSEMSLILIPIPIKTKYFVTFLVLGDLYMGFKGTPIFAGYGSGVAHFAHLGGALVGYIMMWYWNKNQFNNKRWN